MRISSTLNRDYQALKIVNIALKSLSSIKIKGYIFSYWSDRFLYSCETWSLTLREECRLNMFENRFLKRIFGPIANFDVTLFYSSHIHSARRLTYNWVSIALCVITVELTALECSVYVLQVPNKLEHTLIFWYYHLNVRENIVVMT